MTGTPPSLERFRSALKGFPTGVTVVTAAGDNGPSGATANAVVSLSLEPPMMLACLDRRSRTLVAIRASGHFGVNVLAAGQDGIARQFAVTSPEPERKWEGVSWRQSSGIPRLEGTVAWVACALGKVIDGGDHLIATGSVLEVEGTDAKPLVFWRGSYGTIG